MDLPLVSATLFTALFAIFLIRRTLLRRLHGPYPPGPSGLPLLGNALDMAKPRPWIKYTEWSRQYGGILHFRAAGQPVIVLSSRKAIFELLDQRGSIYSGRPRLVMAGELVGWGDSVPMTGYGNRHREFRKLLSEALTARKTQEYYATQEEVTRELLVDLLQSPDRFLHHIRRAVAANVFKITHGHDLEEGEDRLMVLAEQADLEFSETATPGAFIVDVLPFLKYLPRWLNLSWMKKADKYRQTIEAFLNEPYDQVKKEVAMGTAKPSFVSNLIERNKYASAAQEDIYKWVTAGFYGGGADTTVSAIASFILAMSLYPAVQRKAQDELARVVGSARLPAFADRPRLPYIDALVCEVHRWNPVGPMAIPHAVARDDAYEGYFIPAGAVVIPNVWGVLHDPELYPEPFEFKPERYMDGGDERNPDPRKFAFGFGRRVCPGQYLADNSLFIAIAMILAVFDVHPIDDKASKLDFSRSEGYTSGIICHPEPFKCRIVPRSSEAEVLIRGGDPKERYAM